MGRRPSYLFIFFQYWSSRSRSFFPLTSEHLERVACITFPTCSPLAHSTTGFHVPLCQNFPAHSLQRCPDVNPRRTLTLWTRPLFKCSLPLMGRKVCLRLSFLTILMLMQLPFSFRTCCLRLTSPVLFCFIPYASHG